MKMVLATNNHDTKNESNENHNHQNGQTNSDQELDHDLLPEKDGDGGMRVGKSYQAVIPHTVPKEDRRKDQPDKALLVWSPTKMVAENKLDEFILLAKEKYGYNAEQALGMLFWHKHDMDKAIVDLSNFTPFPDEWSVEDKVLFEQAFQFHGKNFHRIKQMLPDKSIASLVKYYYSWKKTRSRTSLIDKQAKKLATQREEGGAEIDHDLASNSEDEQEENKDGVGLDKEESPKLSCGNCASQCSQINPTPKGDLCATCHTYWKKTGLLRPTSGPVRTARGKRPPRGMYLNYDDLITIASGPPGQATSILRHMDDEVVSLKRQVQNNKQILSTSKRRLLGGSEELRKSSNGLPTVSPQFTRDEVQLAIQGFRKFGKNYKVISEILGTKSDAHLMTFFVNYKRRYNLDTVLKEYEAVHGPCPETDELSIEDIEMSEECTILEPPVNSTTASV